MNPIPMLDLHLEYEFMKHEIDLAWKRCLEHQKWILGPEVGELEETISGYLKVGHCIGVSSGTDALVLALRALAINTKGQEFFDEADEVITSPFTFTATGDSIVRSGARPVFVDIDPVTFNIDAVKLQEYLEVRNSRNSQAQDSKVVGIVPVHLYGQSCQMDEIMALAEEHNLFVVEDVAQAFGGSWNGQRLGTIGTAGAFSFFPAKNLGGFGDGGMISTNDNKLAELMRMLLKHGGKDKFNAEHVGYNARLDTLQAAIILAKVKHIDEFIAGRQKVAGQYNKGLSGIKGIEIPGREPGATHVYNQYALMVSEREELITCLKEKGITTAINYPYPLHQMKAFGNGRSKSAGSLVNAETVSRSVCCLPIGPLQNDRDTKFVIDSVKRCQQGLTGKSG